MKIDNKNFCAVPFVQLNTRGKGNARVCCSIGGLDYGIPKELTIDQLSPDNYNAKTDVYNLGTDKIEALWNSKFMRDFRMKMLNGEKISNCEFCHRMEASGLTSKRLSKNKTFLKKTEPLLPKYEETGGIVDIPPQWWEIRLSTKCNLSCIMCAPGLSTMMFNEFKKWEKQGNITQHMSGSLQIAKDSGEEYLSKSTYFLEQLRENLQHVLFMEFRGGEVFADKHSVDFIEEISLTEYAKNIKLDISTNATILTEKILTILNRFKGGKLRYSIDAYKEKDELIRYHTNWDTVVENMYRANKLLKPSWIFWSQTTMQFANCMYMDELVKFFDDFVKETQSNRFYIGFTTVRAKDWLRHENVPLEERQKQIEILKEFMKTSYLCNESVNKDWHIKSMNQLISALSTPAYNNPVFLRKAKEYFDTLSKNRNQSYYEMYPCIQFLKDVE
jgi:sulfatase maturation enzyme AslB (radical SAM superfamily)